MLEGVISGIPMADFLPFHMSALDQVEGLLPWVMSWLGEKCIVLEPEGWYERGHNVVGGIRNSDGI
jgi:hypothetical protein